MKRNILLVFILIILSLSFANIFGSLVVSKLFNSGGFATFSLPSDLGDFLNGFPFVYLFLSPFLFISFGKGKKILWSVLSILPILYFLFNIESGTKIWFWSLIFFVSGAIIANVVNFLRNRA